MSLERTKNITLPSEQLEGELSTFQDEVVLVETLENQTVRLYKVRLFERVEWKDSRWLVIDAINVTALPACYEPTGNTVKVYDVNLRLQGDWAFELADSSEGDDWKIIDETSRPEFDENDFYLKEYEEYLLEKETYHEKIIAQFVRRARQDISRISDFIEDLKKAGIYPPNVLVWEKDFNNLGEGTKFFGGFQTRAEAENAIHHFHYNHMVDCNAADCTFEEMDKTIHPDAWEIRES